MGASIGGGRINICQIDGITTNFGGDHNTLIVHNQDTPGHVAAVTTCLSQHGVNIATMQLYRSTAGATPSWCWSATSLSRTRSPGSWAVSRASSRSRF